MASSTLSDAALAHAYRGWAVFPCEPRGKRPLTSNGFKAATTDAEQIRAWWAKWPQANVAYATGRLIVVEIDGPIGAETMTRLREQHEWPETLTSMSGRPGLHMFFQPPSGEPIRNAAGARGSRGLGPGIDVRASGGYVILPPSIHPTGRRYEWVNRAAVVALPEWMARKLRPPAPTRVPIRETPRGDLTRYAAAALDGECQSIETAPDGTQNAQINDSAFNLGRRFVATGLLPESVVYEALLAAASRGGHPESRARATIRSGLTSGMGRR